VARQLAAHTVVKWFGGLSFDEQQELLGQMQHEHEQSRLAKRAELEKQLAQLGFGAPKKRGRPKGASNGAARHVRKNGSRNGSVKAKYRDPKTKDAWSGRGRMANWLKSKQDAGEKIEKYLV
jgi:DNA-binding protein H-NS